MDTGIPVTKTLNVFGSCNGSGRYLGKRGFQQIEAKSTCHMVCYEKIKLVNELTNPEGFAK